ncbi:MAG TPA: gamma-glutamyltransferase family protein, partial [Polyangiaceae bacterium]
MRFQASEALLTFAFACSLYALSPSLDAQPAAARMAAATENKIATREALEQMRAGGNAVDAAVSAALVGGVVSPSSSGLGGGGFALVWHAREKKPFLLDFRETAPLAIDVGSLESRRVAKPERGRWIGIPGEPRGLFEIHQRFGVRRWKEIVAPAVRWAEQGFPLGEHVANTLTSMRDELHIDAAIHALYYPLGRPALVGTRVRNPALAATLKRLRDEGPQAIYEGSIAAQIVEESHKLGGAVSRADLAAYRAVQRTPLQISWEGYDVYSMPPPSAGGLMLAEVLGLFSSAELRKLGLQSGEYAHVLAEAMRVSILDRVLYLGDPDQEKIDLGRLLSKDRLVRIKSHLNPKLTHSIPSAGLSEHGTHHLVTADVEGNMVSLTTTINNAFGAKVTAGPSGILLNDELDDFTRQNQIIDFGPFRSPNRARPGARPVSSMTPTLVVRNGEPVLALGGSGGLTIATNVTQVLLARLAFHQSPEQAVRAPRFLVPMLTKPPPAPGSPSTAVKVGATIQLEPGAPA